MKGAGPNAQCRHISVVVPAYNEEAVLPEFHGRLARVMAGTPHDWSVLYVDDGSSDGTLKVLEALRAEHPEVAIVELSRNFGKEIALTAGIDHAPGDAVVVIDADLQDPPELIPELIKKWAEEGWDVVYAQRAERHGELWLKKLTAHLFYRLIARFSRVPIPHDTGDFRLLSRRAVNALRELKEQHRFMKGLFAWIGFPQTAVLYRRDPRYAGETKWSYWKLWNLAVEGFTSFSVAPLQLSSYLGLTVAGASFLYGLVIVYKTLVFGEDVPGYPSLMVVVLFLGGVQLMALGVIGEYLGRVFNETKRRPLYFVRRFEPASSIAATQSTGGGVK